MKIHKDRESKRGDNRTSNDNKFLEGEKHVGEWSLNWQSQES